jgi:hypothetical protein
LDEDEDDIAATGGQKPAMLPESLDLNGMTESQRELAQNMAPMLPLFAQAVCSIMRPEQNNGERFSKTNSSGKRRAKEARKREKEKETPEERRMLIVRYLG